MRIFRKVTTRPLPSGATIRGDTARWRPRGSERHVTAPITRHADGRVTVAAASATWYAEYREADGRLVTVNTRCRDEGNARLFLAAAARRVEQVAAGVLTPAQAKAAGRSREALADHFGAFVASIRGKRGGPPSPVHVANVARYLARLAADLDWRTLGDLSRESLTGWIQSRQRPGPDGLAIRSAASINRHATAAKSFAGWASSPDVGRLPSNPFLDVKPTNEEADPRRHRRALTPDELDRLCEAARTAPRHGRAKLDGPGRAALWWFLAGSGLRVAETRAIRCRDVYLDAIPPVIKVPAARSKAGRVETVPIRSDLLPLLARHMEGKGADDPVFIVPSDLCKRFNHDCKRAGIVKRDARGYTVDVHALRHTFGTMLARNGVPIQTSMRLMRQSTSRLTESVYVDPSMLPTAAALESTLPGGASFAGPAPSFAGIGASFAGNAPAEPADGPDEPADAPASFADGPASFAASFAGHGGDSRESVTIRGKMDKLGGRKQKAPGVA